MTIATADLRERVVSAYFREAELLDSHDLGSWLSWVSDDFRYEVPIPITRDDIRAPQYSKKGLLAAETRDSIALWVSRLSPSLADAAYAENPPVRTRHFVTNVRMDRDPDSAQFLVRSNVLLTWGKWNEEARFLSAERHDEISAEGGELTLHRRTVFIDTNVVRLGHLRVII